ncbi:MAG: geranylgeranyl reductase family protein [Actinomycetota bacterium]
MTTSNGAIDTDVLVVGAGPGGAAAAYHLARHGIDVTIVDKATFPREKVCGDGLTPRAVKQVERMGVDTTDPIFERVEGLRVYSRRVTLELAWPKLEDFPDYALVATRSDFDALLARRAEKAGARLLEATEAVSPIVRDGWVTGAMVRPSEDRDAEPTEIRAKIVFAADGASSRFAGQAGVKRDASRPLGIAARRYYRTDRHPGPWFESWLDLWEGDELLPGYGWLFPVADGTLNLGAGLLNTFKNFKDVSAQRLFDAFISMMPADWNIGEASAEGRILSGPLPMGMNRAPLAVPGLLLIGDAAGVVSPFNGEGISYAMETGEVAAELANDALVSGRMGRAMLYPTVLRELYGSYFTLGRAFAKAIGDPRIMQASTRLMLPNRAVMRFAMRVLANLTDGKDGDAQDKLIYVVERLAPAS